jgi:hypothetical protein
MDLQAEANKVKHQGDRTPKGSAIAQTTSPTIAQR